MSGIVRSTASGSGRYVTVFTNVENTVHFVLQSTTDPELFEQVSVPRAELLAALGVEE